jgi:hypothetical protein
MTIPAVFPIGKTQWRKWTDAQRGTFNRLRADGVPHQEAIDRVNTLVFETETVETVETAPTPAPAPKKSRAPRKPRKDT